MNAPVMPKGIRKIMGNAQAYADKKGVVVRVYLSGVRDGVYTFRMTTYSNAYRPNDTLDYAFPRWWPYQACVMAITTFKRGR